MLKLAEAQAGGIKYMGVYQRAVEYEHGSLVTFDGSTCPKRTLLSHR